LFVSFGYCWNCYIDYRYFVFLGKSCEMIHDLKHLKDLTVDRARLAGGTIWRIANNDLDREIAVHILIGKISVNASHNGRRVSWYGLGERGDVFRAPPTILYLGTSSSVEMWSASRTADCLISTAKVDGTHAPALIRPADVVTHEIGEGHYRRTVREVIGGNGSAARLRIGETINPPGMWSSWPPHSFDRDDMFASKFEEVFFYWTKPVIPGQSSEAYQRRRGYFCNGDMVDDMLVVKSGDSAVMPLGSHPVAAGLDCSLCYTWIYISPIAKQYAQWAEGGAGYA
jgi:5-deoxy-glucuronate isomerase